MASSGLSCGEWDLCYVMLDLFFAVVGQELYRCGTPALEPAGSVLVVACGAYLFCGMGYLSSPAREGGFYGMKITPP